MRCIIHLFFFKREHKLQTSNLLKNKRHLIVPAGSAWCWRYLRCCLFFKWWWRLNLFSLPFIKWWCWRLNLFLTRLFVFVNCQTSEYWIQLFSYYPKITQLNAFIHLCLMSKITQLNELIHNELILLSFCLQSISTKSNTKIRNQTHKSKSNTNFELKFKQGPQIEHKTEDYGSCRNQNQTQTSN